ncbi:MAG: division/cell wall cluster transcriptional repressor MraZ [Bacteroidetes bacterium GWC2_33_15]|nr:MAG: division/cell wall cluster transcriptional repressor MraZ [Bacteroidetes bacterium GWA2_33_15]OFX51248.1 MAG: division/cell wall cluster transcriptional repressor MraZ [Bacteroidetes bacterium GWC2_33_15]OFX66358.1 MAG: division/cell wall cluster transcriptional repressor MraZ [Bacteroidetes bacterium GWB2_32_14]OFX70651.1 MAG: division/cell wall cluster transcriptional repressor MraZ [Bacteroidetes bacterium GWD2_33_33]HAN18759.1 division/cell wall cluster transcriptional repressor Mra
MTTFIGDYNCKVDEKGRVTFPSMLKKQMNSASGERFVVKTDIFEKCLILFPMEEWERQNAIIRSKINPYNKEHNKFLRNFYKGSAEVILDSNNRLLIPKRLLDLANISKEAILAGQDGKIEIWSKDLYDAMAENQDDFAELAEKIMGGNINKEME